MLDALKQWFKDMGGPEYTPPAQSIAPKAATPLTGKDLLEIMSGGMPAYTGRAINEQAAMCVSAVYAAVGLIGGAVASLPISLYQLGKDGEERRKVDRYAANATADLWWLLNQQPHPTCTAAVFWEYMMWSLLLHGDAFALIERRQKSPIAFGFIPVHPDRVQVRYNDAGDVEYALLMPNGEARVTDRGDILHVPGVGWDGLRGMSVIRYAAKQSMGISLAAEEFSARFFANGAKPDIALLTEGDLTDEAVNTLRNTWQQRYGGVLNSHLPAVLTGGMKVQELTMNADDAALLATRQFQVIDIARIFGVPPFMIGETEKTSSWGTGVENMGIGFVKYTLQRHLTKIEQELNRKLFPRTARTFAEFIVEGLLRGDSKTRAEFYKNALGGSAGPGWMTPNEVRRLENLPPAGEGDTLSKGSADAPKPAPAPAG